MKSQFSDRLSEILVVEDNPADVRLIVEALQDGKLPNRVHVVSDGCEAIEFLRRSGKHFDAPRPDLIFLDLNLPRKSGREVLAEIKTHPDLARIPVVMLTGSDAPEDIVGAYELHANLYVTKPVDLDQFIQVVRTTQEFLLTVVQLPNEKTLCQAGQ